MSWSLLARLVHLVKCSSALKLVAALAARLSCPCPQSASRQRIAIEANENDVQVGAFYSGAGLLEEMTEKRASSSVNGGQRRPRSTRPRT